MSAPPNPPEDPPKGPPREPPRDPPFNPLGEIRRRAPSRNLLGGPLEPCSREPLTGFYRNGCCDTGVEDLGSHTVCVVLTAEFLAFSKVRGNDLSTPRPEFRFAGLKPGDRWCLCASRWREAWEAGAAPKVVLAATHREALLQAPLEDFLALAADPPAEKDGKRGEGGDGPGRDQDDETR